MLLDDRLRSKFERLCALYEPHRFDVVLRPEAEFAETSEHRRRPPADLAFRRCPPGTLWGRQWGSAWFRTAFSIPRSCRGRRVLARLPNVPGAHSFGGREFLVFLGAAPRGILCDMHRETMLLKRAKGGERLRLHIEGYAGHHVPGGLTTDGGLRPRSSEERSDADFRSPFPGIEIVVENTNIADLIDDMRALIETAQHLEPNSLRRHEILGGLQRAYLCLESDPDWSDPAEWRRRVAVARRELQPLLSRRNGPTAPTVGIVGHAHIDTAWLWPLSETIRKVARTFSTQLTLAEEYPEIRFHQSQPLHMEWVRDLYPALFARVKTAYRKGQWEPGGGMWVEADCNVTGGEAMIRQFLAGHRATRELFDGYEADTLWLPDVFGYSAAMPQILRGCGIRYFVTSKINWNDTNRFPYDTFRWRGVDGSEVLTHFITCRAGGYNAQVRPSVIHDCWNQVQHKDVQDRVLVSVGYGDGGGGLTEAHCRMARRLRDLEGNPKVEWVNVSDFLRRVAARRSELPVWTDELYLELHRGTYTSQGRIKRGNRKCELALRDAEFACAAAWLNGRTYPAKFIRRLWKEVLTLQFHDILPGSSIRRVNVEAEATYARVLEELDRITRRSLQKAFGRSAVSAAGRPILLANTLNWERNDVIRIPAPRGAEVVDGRGRRLPAQTVERGGRRELAVALAGVPSLAAKTMHLRCRAARTASGGSAFRIGEDRLETPFYRIRFDRRQRIRSLVDKAAGREIVRAGAALNTLLLAEDLPAQWDNWDIDADIALMLHPAGRLISSGVVSTGPVEHRIRNRYDFGVFHASGRASTLTQDLVLYAHDRRIDFETAVEWNHSHRLLRASFPLDLLADRVRCEIQYGHVERPTSENTSWERAMHEICAHKWVDVSESDYGVALLNDCKYGHHVRGATVDLTLLRSGCHPDEKADQGEHRFTYSLVPHLGGFSAAAVVRPAYELNAPVIVGDGVGAVPDGSSLLTVDNTTTVIESVKKAEDEDALVVRLYDAEKTRRRVTVTASRRVRRVVECDMRERHIRSVPARGNSWTFQLNPFEIKTFKVALGR